MEFKTTVQGATYTFNFLSTSSFLVSANHAEYILYKTSCWHCADQIPDRLLKTLGSVIDEQLKTAPH